MAIGAVFGALNTMYSSVAARTREIATLRALGFGRGAVVVSVMLEALALALVGGAAGAGVAYFVFNGFHAATMNWQSFSQVTFAFRRADRRAEYRGVPVAAYSGAHRALQNPGAGDGARARTQRLRVARDLDGDEPAEAQSGGEESVSVSVPHLGRPGGGECLRERHPDGRETSQLWYARRIEAGWAAYPKNR
jgi:hypothetical protein